MKKLTLIICAVIFAFVFAAWSAYWFVVRSIVEDRVVEWVELQRQQGISVGYRGIDFDGYPTLLAMKVVEPSFANALGNFEVSGTEFTATLKPWDFSAIQINPRGVFQVNNVNRQHTFDVGEHTLVGLRQDSLTDFRLRIESDNLKWTLPNYGSLQLSGVGVEAQISQSDNKIGVKSEVSRIDLPREIATLPCIGKTSINNLLEIELENLWSTTSSSDPAIFKVGRGTSINVKALNYSHGAMHVQARSKLKISDRGHLDGLIDLRLDNGDELLRVLSGSCMQGVPRSGQTRFALAALNSGSADGQYLKLAVENGVVKLFGFDIYEFPPIVNQGRR